jgi:hypothetical protein
MKQAARKGEEITWDKDENAIEARRLRSVASEGGVAPASRHIRFCKQDKLWTCNAC